MVNQHVLLETIRKFQESGESGALRLEKAREAVTVYFIDGLIGAVATNIDDLRLGCLLAQHGILDGRGIEPLLAEARRRGTLLGEAAVTRRLVEPAELGDLLQEQAVRILRYALEQSFPVVSFEKRRLSLYMPARLGLDQLMLELSRIHLRPMRLEPHESVVLRDDSATSHLPWFPHELAVLTALKEPRTLQELAVLTGQEYTRLCKILGVLEAMRFIRRVSAPASETTALVKRDAFPYESLIPEISRDGLDERVKTSMDEATFVAEQFRNLKVRIQELGRSQPVRLITVSSADPGAGKSFVGMNLALSFSKELGRRVLLIDADLRNPAVHRCLGTTLEPGLLGYLETDYLQPYCYMRRFGRLFVLTAGGSSANPVEMLSQDKMRRLAEYLRASFDAVIIDTPPIVPVSDTQVLTSLTDGLLLVVRSGRTTYASVEAALKVVDRSKLLGMVLNDVQPLLFHTEYYHRYYSYAYRHHYPYVPHRPPVRRKTYLDES